MRASREEKAANYFKCTDRERAVFEAGMRASAETFEKLHAWNPQVAQYVVPNAYKRRVLAQFNLREAYAFCQLRSAPNAHFSMRRIAERVYEAIRQVAVQGQVSPRTTARSPTAPRSSRTRR
jgi:thymidylate synthase ThyX